MALTAQQRKDRRLGVGGSDIAALFGVPGEEITKWATPLDIYLEKVSTEEIEEEPDFLAVPNESGFYDIPAKDWGNELEDKAREWFMRATNLKVEVVKDPILHPKYPYMRANIDGKIVGHNAVLECKTTHALNKKMWSDKGGDNIPEAYLLQCAYYAEILGVETVYIVVIIGTGHFRIYKYDRKPELGKIILDKVTDFWENRVLRQIPPDPIKQEDAFKLWPTATEESITADEKILEVCNELRHLRIGKKTLEAQLSLKQLELCKFIQDAQQLIAPSGEALATWKTQSTNRFDANALKAEHPELYARYIKTSQSRVLRLKGEKE